MIVWCPPEGQEGRVFSPKVFVFACCLLRHWPAYGRVVISIRPCIRASLTRNFARWCGAGGITDSDTKERKALLFVWEDMTLLLCRYHFSKACTNHLVKTLGSGGSKEEVLYRNTAKSFIRQFLERYSGLLE